jgi:hypothetical protein
METTSFYSWASPSDEMKSHTKKRWHSIRYIIGVLIMMTLGL